MYKLYYKSEQLEMYEDMTSWLNMDDEIGMSES